MRTTKDEAAAEGTLTRKEMQARDGAAAMAEYQAARKALVDNTARLREARIAREAAEVEARKAAPAKEGAGCRGSPEVIGARRRGVQRPRSAPPEGRFTGRAIPSARPIGTCGSRRRCGYRRSIPA